MGAVQGLSVGNHVAADRAIRWLTVLSLAVALGMVALGSAVLIDARQDAWRQAEQASMNLVTALERDVARTFAIYDLSLRGAAEAMALPGLDGVSPAIRQAALFDRSGAAEYFGEMCILNKDGDVVYNSSTAEPARYNLAERDFFRVQRDRPDVGLYVSRTYRTGLRDEDRSLALTRRLNTPDGQFAGVVMGTLRLSYFNDLIGNLTLGPNGAVSFVRTDGYVIFRKSKAGIGTDHLAAASELMKQVATAPTGLFEATSALDGARRVVAFRQVGAQPLVITVAEAVEDIAAPWWRKAIGIGSILFILCGATLLLCLLFRREMLRRQAAEDALLDTADKLSVMASTDELTGLANRRAFEADMLQEWRRAARNQWPLAVVILDADYFKLYNDHYGHQEGDDVLRKIADVIRQCIRRPGDIGARYGGEEFVALLPDTHMEGAAACAERICTAVAALGIDHADAPLGYVTVSVGVAVAYPGGTEDEDGLIRRADKALYDAKHAGRARVCISELAPIGGHGNG